MKNLNKCKILIVDDIKTNLDILISALGDEYKLGVAMNGNKAIDYIKRNHPDLVLLDVMMPGLNGFEVCHKLKEDPITCKISIIFITAVDAPVEKAKGFELGAVDYITKPFDAVEVKARVETHLKLKLYQEALKNQNIILEEKVRERTKELEETKIEILERLCLAVEYRDNETGQHINRLRAYCMIMGEALGLDSAECNNISLASSMHDIGKIGIPDPILFKQGKLTKEEMTIMRTHTTIGARILSDGKSKLLQIAETISLTHHEKWNGTGYPNGLKKEEIPLVGRITGICDSFDALISERPYKKAWPVEKAFEEIQNESGTHYDPKLVELFVKSKAEFSEIVQNIKKR